MPDLLSPQEVGHTFISYTQYSVTILSEQDTINKNVYFDSITGMVVLLMRRFVPIAQKAFGTLIYQDTEVHDFSYIVIENEQSFLQSIKND